MWPCDSSSTLRIDFQRSHFRVTHTSAYNPQRMPLYVAPGKLIGVPGWLSMVCHWKLTCLPWESILKMLRCDFYGRKGNMWKINSILIQHFSQLWGLHPYSILKVICYLKLHYFIHLETENLHVSKPKSDLLSKGSHRDWERLESGKQKTAWSRRLIQDCGKFRERQPWLLGTDLINW